MEISPAHPYHVRLTAVPENDRLGNVGLLLSSIKGEREEHAVFGMTDLYKEGRAMNQVALYVASALTGLWGIAHLFATKGVVKGFGDISVDNRRVITMEWIVEGVALISIAMFVLAAATQPLASVSSAIYAVAIATLVVLAIVSLFTGFKVSFPTYKLCPFIFGVSAALIVWGAWV